jgi:hypothetical protein
LSVSLEKTFTQEKDIGQRADEEKNSSSNCGERAENRFEIRVPNTIRDYRCGHQANAQADRRIDGEGHFLRSESIPLRVFEPQWVHNSAEKLQNDAADSSSHPRLSLDEGILPNRGNAPFALAVVFHGIPPLRRQVLPGRHDLLTAQCAFHLVELIVRAALAVG